MDPGESGSTPTCSYCGTAAGRASEPAEPAGPDDDSAPAGAAPTGAVRDSSDDATDATDTFCSSGCRHLQRVFGSSAAQSRDTNRTRGSTPTGDANSSPRGATGRDSTGPVSAVDGSERGSRDPVDGSDEGHERTFFRVDGMHAAHCEAFLEAVATGCDGVADASASYVTESVRVDYDSDRIDPAALEDRLTGVGYTAYHREGAADDVIEPTSDPADEPAVGPADATGELQRSREMGGLRKRRSEDMLAMRYVVGIVFGSFLLVPYAAIFYPVYLAELVSWGPLALYEDAFTSLDSIVLPVFLVLTGTIVYLTGAPLLRGAYVAIRLREPNAALLATLSIVAAYAYAAIAVLTGHNHVYFDFTILVTALVMGAIYWEAEVKRESFARLTDLTHAAVAEARRIGPDGTTSVVPTAQLEPGDRILVRQGERIPVDGTLAEGECTVEESIVTGESLPRPRAAGDAVVGGAAVTGGAAVVAVGDRTTSRIDRLTRTVWDLQSARHGATGRVDALAARALPLVIGLAVLAAGATLALGGDSTAAARSFLLAVVAASPWALAFATPCAVAATLREAAEAGVVVFDETVLDRLRDVDTVVFDKTGTLTAGEMTVLDAAVPPAALEAAAALERRASHPAGAAIVEAVELAADEGGDGADGLDGDCGRNGADGWSEADRPNGDDEPSRSERFTDGGTTVGDAGDRSPEVESFETYATGVGGVVDGEATLVGHRSLFDSRDWVVAPSIETRIEAVRASGELPVVVGRNGRALGVVAVGDRPRRAWEATIEAIDDRGMDVVVLTGDGEQAAGFLADHAAVTRVFAGVSPAGKTETIRRLAAEGRVAMVGDGTNDAPALAAADLGISLGGGTALATDAADLAMADDELGAVGNAFDLADAAARRRRGTLALAFAYPAIALPVAVVGLLSPLVTTLALAATAAAIALYATLVSGAPETDVGAAFRR